MSDKVINGTIDFIENNLLKTTRFASLFMAESL